MLFGEIIYFGKNMLASYMNKNADYFRKLANRSEVNFDLLKRVWNSWNNSLFSFVFHYRNCLTINNEVFSQLCYTNPNIYVCNKAANNHPIKSKCILYTKCILFIADRIVWVEDRIFTLGRIVLGKNRLFSVGLGPCISVQVLHILLVHDCHL